MARKWNTWTWVALILLIVGGLNWGLVGIFSWNLVDAIFGTFLQRIIYTLVGVAAIYTIFWIYKK
ncbi:MAG: DUF378 domain-containing protein [Nanoarchaeota archaeon]|nr:DUF378 domain-containing protein [Nanoarchaeota archaeon]